MQFLKNSVSADRLETSPAAENQLYGLLLDIISKTPS
jgi:hypothetical protein